MRLKSLLVSLPLLVMLAVPGWAQRGSDGGGGRGGFGGPGGGFGGPGGGFGGPGGGFGGPGGGFGGPGGGFGGGFGGPGGGFGGPGGSSGFNPMDMLRRFDANRNNMLDPDEAQGPARFFLDRMAQNNPRIDLSKPIPLDRLASEMDRMRQERGGGGPGMPGGGPGSPQSTAPKEPEPLVPGFDKIEEKTGVMGFGIPDGSPTVKTEERDVREAEDRIKRYDKNNDGQLSKEEIEGGRWSDDPWQYDRNKDGKLNKTELAVRYAKRRMGDQGGQPPNGQSNDPRSRMSSSGSSWGSRGGDGGSSWGSRGGDGGSSWGGRGGDSRGGDNGGWGSRGGDQNAQVASADSKKAEIKSYRSGSSEARANEKKGLPDWFARNDANSDDQVSMAEYSTSWNQEKLAEFQSFDLNSDGIITIRECLLAIKNGARAGSTGGSSSGSSPVASSASASTSSPANVTTPASDDANREWAARQIARYDKNKDNRLTVDEWESMLLKPVGADTDGDGAITLDEYAKFRAKK